MPAKQMHPKMSVYWLMYRDKQCGPDQAAPTETV